LIEIFLDASQLEVLEKCPRNWLYGYVQNLEPRHSNKNFDVGSYWHEVLAHYYAPTKKWDAVERLRSAIEYMKEPARCTKYSINDEARTFHVKRFTEYAYRYFSEDETTESIAVEQGFTWLLYEDAHRRYYLEGKIDWVKRAPQMGLTVTDHKTQSRYYEKWELNHQVMNYLSFTKAAYFEYNYIGLQDKAGPNTFHRSIYKPHPGMLEQWQSEVKLTFDSLYHIAKAAEDNCGILDLHEFERLCVRRRAACETKYGVCSFHKLCSVPDDSKWVQCVKSAYKEKDSKWRAWS
jgi:hypothetical protein